MTDLETLADLLLTAERAEAAASAQRMHAQANLADYLRNKGVTADADGDPVRIIAGPILIEVMNLQTNSPDWVTVERCTTAEEIEEGWLK